MSVIKKKIIIKSLTVFLFILALTGLIGVAPTYASKICGGSHPVSTAIDFGCDSKGNPQADLIFAIIRWLSAGVGVVVVLSIVVGGLQYIGSQGEPNNTAKAVERIRNAIIALLIYIFSVAIIDFIVPGQVLK